MRQWGRVGMLVLALTSFMAIVSVNAADADTPPRQPTRVFGSVTLGGSPAPSGTVIGATVNSVTYRTSTTDSSGNFGFNIPADNLETNAKDGAEEGDTVIFVVGPDSGISGSGYTGDVGSYSVTFGVGATPPKLTLIVPSSQVLSLSSTVPAAPAVGALVTSNNALTDLDGNSISGVNVSVLWGDSGSDSGVTDGSGAYSVNHVYSSVGSYSIGVTAGKSGYTSVSASLSTNVVSASTSGGGGGGFFFGPRQPTPTETPTPTPTPTITPTPTKTPIPTKEAIGTPIAVPTPIEADTTVTTATGEPERVPTPTAAVVAVTPTPSIEVPDIGKGMVVSDLGLSDDAVGAGIPVKINFTLTNTNTGNDASPYTVTIVVNGAVESTLTGVLKGGGIRSLSHSMSRSVPGTYIVSVGNLTESFVVLGPKIELYNLDVYPQVVEIGGSVLVSVRVENAGAAPGVYDTEIAVGGNVAQTFKGKLVPGKAKTLAVKVVLNEAGSYSVSAGNLSDQIVVLPKLVDQAIPTEFAISALATTALDADGNKLELTGDKVSLEQDAEGNTRVVFPVGLAIGANLSSFEDSASGISIKNGILTIPVRDVNGNVTMQISGEIAFTEGTGSSAVATLKKGTLRLKISDQVMDMTLADQSVGKAMIGFIANLTQIPEGAELSVIAKKALQADVYGGFEGLANETDLSIVNVAMVVEVNRTGLQNGTHVGSTTAQLRVGNEWVTSVGGVSAVHIARQADDGSMGFLETNFVGKDAQGRMMFDSISPQGFSVFALLALGSKTDDLEYSDLRIDPLVVAPGEAVDIGVTVYNKSNTTQSQSVVLEINGVSEDVRPITLAGGSQGTVTFTVMKEETGKYNVGVGELSGSFDVAMQLDAELLTFGNLKIDPSLVAPGEDVTLKVLATNSSQRSGKFDIELTINDVLTDIASIVLAAGESVEVEFLYTATAEGRYSVWLHGLSGSFSVQVPLTPADISVTEMSLSPKEIAPGDTVTVMVLLVNKGQEQGTMEVAVLINGEIDQYREIIVPGLSTEPVTFGVSRSMPGSYTVLVGGLTETFRVIGGALRDLEFDLSVTILETSETFSMGETIGVEPGQAFEVKVKVRNTNPYPIQRTIELLVDGSKFESREIELAGGETKEITFVVTLTEKGQHTISVGNITQVIEVRADGGTSMVGIIAIAVTSIIIIVIGAWVVVRRRSGMQNGQDGDSSGSSEQQQ